MFYLAVFATLLFLVILMRMACEEGQDDLLGQEILVVFKYRAKGYPSRYVARYRTAFLVPLPRNSVRTEGIYRVLVTGGFSRSVRGKKGCRYYWECQVLENLTTLCNERRSAFLASIKGGRSRGSLDSNIDFDAAPDLDAAYSACLDETGNLAAYVWRVRLSCSDPQAPVWYEENRHGDVVACKGFYVLEADDTTPTPVPIDQLTGSLLTKGALKLINYWMVSPDLCPDEYRFVLEFRWEFFELTSWFQCSELVLKNPSSVREAIEGIVQNLRKYRGSKRH